MIVHNIIWPCSAMKHRNVGEIYWVATELFTQSPLDYLRFSQALPTLSVKTDIKAYKVFTPEGFTDLNTLNNNHKVGAFVSFRKLRERFFKRLQRLVLFHERGIKHRGLSWTVD